MARMSVNVGKTKVSKAPTPGAEAPFVLGSRPVALRDNTIPRIKPALAQRNYGKAPKGGSGYQDNPGAMAGMPEYS